MRMHSNRFPKSSRLAQAAEFLKVRHEGVAQHGRYLIVNLLREAPAGKAPNRVGIITSRKVGNAVHRNRARRHIREIMRHLLPQLKPGAWIVIVCKPRASDADQCVLREELEKLLQRGGVWAA